MTRTIAAGGRAARWLARPLPSCLEIAKATAVNAALSLGAAFWLGILSPGGIGVALIHAQGTDRKDTGSSQLVEVTRWIDGKRPSFALDDLTGARHDLANASGRLVLVHFFATWCEPCREELPALQRLIDRSGHSTLAIFAISVGEPDQRVRRFFEGAPLRYPVVLDRDREAAKTWRVQSLPTTYVLDRGLEPRLVVEGEFEWDRVANEQMLEALLSARQGASSRDGG
jgi:peroxiredoxin